MRHFPSSAFNLVVFTFYKGSGSSLPAKTQTPRHSLSGSMEGSASFNYTFPRYNMAHYSLEVLA